MNGLMQTRRRYRIAWRVGLIGLLLLGIVGSTAVPARAADDVGYRGVQFADPGDFTNPDNSPTGEKPQSKLWFNDGKWWGILKTKTSGGYRIFRLDSATQQWAATGTLIDARPTSHADALWDGTKLFVGTASVPNAPAGTDDSIQVRRFSYNSGTKTYSLDSSFPVTLANGPVEAIVIDKEPTGMVWATYTKSTGAGARKVYVAHSSGANTTSWIAPYVLPGSGDISEDDISTLVAFDNKIGVLWSDQSNPSTSAFYFATHGNGTADNQWSVAAILQGMGVAEDHINIKSLQVGPNGQLITVVKTDANSLPNPDPNAPLIVVLVRDPNGNWSSHPFGYVKDKHTRPLALIDSQNGQLYVFATAPEQYGGGIYYKSTPLSTIAFAPGRGNLFIKSSGDPYINNATSTKQVLTGTTGILVLASDISTGYYLHNYIATLQPYTLTATATAGGTVTGGGPYLPGTIAEPLPVPDPGQTFVGWVFDGVPSGWAASPTITMNGNHTIQALFAPTETFSDVATNRVDFVAITELAARGIIYGYGNGDYGPDDGVQRAQMAALIARATAAGPGTPTTNLAPPACLVAGTWDCDDWGNDFTDRGALDGNLWRNVGALQHYGVALGYTAETCAARGLAVPCYGPNDEVTYAQTISFITRAMIAKGYWSNHPEASLPFEGIPLPHQDDLRTYSYYTQGRGGMLATPADWNDQATRGWFALALWGALDSYWGADGNLPDGQTAGGLLP